MIDICLKSKWCQTRGRTRSTRDTTLARSDTASRTNSSCARSTVDYRMGRSRWSTRSIFKKTTWGRWAKANWKELAHRLRAARPGSKRKTYSALCTNSSRIGPLPCRGSELMRTMQTRVRGRPWTLLLRDYRFLAPRSRARTGPTSWSNSWGMSQNSRYNQ